MKNKINIKALLLSAALIVAVITAVVLLVDFETPEEHYSNNMPSENNASAQNESVFGKVSLSMICTDISDKSAEHIPDDGVVFEIKEFEIEDGDTVYDVLLKATARNKIHLETSGNGEAVYVVGIGNIYSGDFGSMSGWSYTVNGEMPMEGCGAFKLRDGDRIEWVFYEDMSVLFQ